MPNSRYDDDHIRAAPDKKRQGDGSIAFRASEGCLPARRDCPPGAAAGGHALWRPERRHAAAALPRPGKRRSEEHTSELQSLMRISYAVFCLKHKNNTNMSYNTQI